MSYKRFVTDAILDNGIIKGHMEFIKTNGDRVRSMTDEELAELIADGFCSTRPDKCNNFKRCIDCTLDWLKDTVEPIPVEESYHILKG